MDLVGNLLRAETTGSQMLNLVAFVLAQVRVAHALLHLAVKPHRLPRLRRSTVAVVHFKIEFAPQSMRNSRWSLKRWGSRRGALAY